MSYLFGVSIVKKTKGKKMDAQCEKYVRESPFETVVIYAYYEPRTGGGGPFNLKFFLDHALPSDDDNVLYIIVVNGSKISVNIPPLPNIIVLTRENTGADYGGYMTGLEFLLKSNNLWMNGKTLTEHWEFFLPPSLINNKRLPYRYYIFINTSVIGPVLPPYYGMDGSGWTKAFTDMLGEKCKMVGTSIEVLLPVNIYGWFGPIVHGFCFALDRDGISFLVKLGHVFKVFKGKIETVSNCEFGSSRAIWESNSNKTVDCLLTKYQGINWRDDHGWKSLKRPQVYIWNLLCQSIAPTMEGQYDESTNPKLSVHPLDVIFHKYSWAGLINARGKHINLDYVTSFYNASKIDPKTKATIIIYCSDIIFAEYWFSDSKSFVNVTEFFKPATGTISSVRYIPSKVFNVTPQSFGVPRFIPQSQTSKPIYLRLCYKDVRDVMHTRLLHNGTILSIRQILEL